MAIHFKQISLDITHRRDDKTYGTDDQGVRHKLHQRDVGVETLDIFGEQNDLLMLPDDVLHRDPGHTVHAVFGENVRQPFAQDIDLTADMKYLQITARTKGDPVHFFA